jgi:hypothetical protein
VTARGNERRAIFHEDADCERFLRALGASLRCLAFHRQGTVAPVEEALAVAAIGHGACVSQHLRKLTRELETNRTLGRQVRAITEELQRRRTPQSLK